MTADCSTFRSNLPRYLADDMASAEQALFRSHLRSCETCRDEAFEAEPTLIFAGVPRPLIGEEEARGILAGVQAAIAVRQAAQKLERQPRSRTLRTPLAAGLIAASLAAFAWIVPHRSPRPGAPAHPEAIRLQSPAGTAEEPLTPASATIYEWNTGATSKTEPKIVWIVDRSIDI